MGKNLRLEIWQIDDFLQAEWLLFGAMTATGVSVLIYLCSCVMGISSNSNRARDCPDCKDEKARNELWIGHGSEPESNCNGSHGHKKCDIDRTAMLSRIVRNCPRKCDFEKKLQALLILLISLGMTLFCALYARYLIASLSVNLHRHLRDAVGQHLNESTVNERLGCDVACEHDPMVCLC